MSNKNPLFAPELNIFITDLFKYHLKGLEEELKNVKANIVKRVIGGETFEEGKWPWLVSLQGKIPEVKVK